jgi:hypothetical protein
MSAMTHRTVAISIQAIIRRGGANRIIVPPHPIAELVANPVTGVLPAIAFPLCGDSAMMFQQTLSISIIRHETLHRGRKFCLLPYC